MARAACTDPASSVATAVADAAAALGRSRSTIIAVRAAAVVAIAQDWEHAADAAVIARRGASRTARLARRNSAQAMRTSQ
eukprot:149936-Heterocapsa_arctica.AAC.1